MRADELAYRLHCELVEDKWHRHNEMVDSWIATGNYEAMQADLEECIKLESQTRELYNRAWPVDEPEVNERKEVRDNLF